MFDAHKNLAISTVQTAPTPPTSGTLVAVASGEFTRFPTAPFSATIWPANQLPNPVTAEVVRVTQVAGDWLTIVRGQEGTVARSIVAGDLIGATITVKTITDLEAGTNFPQLVSAGDVSLGGHIHLTGAGTHLIAPATVDGNDVGALYLAGGGDAAPTRGASIALLGADAAGNTGSIQLVAGDATPGNIFFQTGGGAVRGVMHRSGGLSWGSSHDPGAGTFLVASGPPTAGLAFIEMRGSGTTLFGAPVTSVHNVQWFVNGNGFVGGISCTGTTTAYSTTSDARLKDDLGVLRMDTTGEVLRQTVVHEFTWKADGTPGRGVFAQEAVEVAPFAVTVGTDDAQGQMVTPWAVDYAKYVPDLIVGWQSHDTAVAALTAKVAALEARLAALEAALPPAQG
jgi:hypothetical protein